MTAQQKTKDKKQPKELYLKVPYHIFNIPKLSLAEKVLLAHIYSFGEKGCWQSNKTLAKIFMFSTRTISKYIATLLKQELVQIKYPKGYFRTIWAKSHPEVKAAAQLWHRGKKVENSSNSLRTNVRSECAKSGNRLGTNLPTTNNTTIRETIKDTKAPPAPLPAGGQAPAVLVERDKETREQVERFMRDFGRYKERKKQQQLTEEEFQRRRQANIKAILG